MSETAIELKKVYKEFYNYKNNIQRILGIAFDRKPASTIHALSDISLKINKGERVVFYGMADSGVSTLLKIIMGITYPTKGKVNTTGKLNGYVLRRAGYDYELSAEDNVFMKANAIGLDKKIVKENWDFICEFAEIDKCLKMPMKNAPSGAIVRLALALHLLIDCDIFVLDDKFGLGGTGSRKKCEKLLKEYLDKNPDVTLVSSFLDGAFTKANYTRGIVLHKGEIVFDGDVVEGYHKYEAYIKEEKLKA